MDPFLGLNDPLSNLDPFDLHSETPFDSYWQDGDPEGPSQPNPPKSSLDGEHRVLEEIGDPLQAAGLVQLQDYDSDAEPPPECIRYTIEWKAVLKTTRLGLDTEQDVFLAPAAFWDVKLRKRVDETLDDRFSSQLI